MPDGPRKAPARLWIPAPVAASRRRGIRSRARKAMQPRDIEDMYATEATHWWFSGKRLLMRRLLGERLRRPGLRILDVGCGAGATAVDFSADGRVCACDRSLHALRFVGERGIATRVAADAAGLPFRDGAFDVVLALDVLEHVTDDAGFLRELGRVLAPGGALAIHVPAWPSLWSRHDEVLEHKRRYTRRTLKALLRDSPLQIAYLGWASCAIFPVTVAIRLARRLTNAESEGADLGVVPAWLNRLLTGVYRVESSLAVYTGLPFGVSLAVIAICPE
ncbi:MAG: methyltransferase domain-containing protein [Deltaproteobacteria bacterium]|nr:methyltransferase domain-containing protein [Deltaproteobacteria bacterium]